MDGDYMRQLLQVRIVMAFVDVDPSGALGDIVETRPAIITAQEWNEKWASDESRKQVEKLLEPIG